MAGKAVAVKPEATANEAQIISDETRAIFAPMVMMVPEAEGDGMDRILKSILSATSWDALNDPWSGEPSAAMVGVELMIGSITRHVSTYSEGLGVFLVLHGKRMDDNSEFAFACGSLSVVAQLVRAYALAAFPLFATLRKSDKPTKRGYYPMHLDITASAAKA